jgi:hypothetical protein
MKKSALKYKKRKALRKAMAQYGAKLLKRLL